MRNRHNEKRQVKRNMFDIKSSEFGSSKQPFNKEVDGGLFGDEEIDSDYEWLLSFLTDNNEQTKSSTEEVIAEDENEDIAEVENEDISEDANEKDPQYCLFLKALTKNGKSYKLKISKNDETPKFLEYEKEEKSDGFDLPNCTNISVDNSGDKVNSSKDMGDKQINRRVKRSMHGKKRELSTTKEISKKKKIKEHKSTTNRFNDVPSCYRVFLDGCLESKYGEFMYEGKHVNYEEKPTSSDSDIQIWDNLRDCGEVNNKQLMTAKKEPSLKEKLMRVLRKPYNQEEYEQLSEYVEQEKPICRLLPLRHRAISSALDGETKSVLDDVPRSFRRKLQAAQNERPRALNLLRMFRFWLEHVPNEDVFQPWLNDECLKVLPSTRR